jgi:hypothetical protein
VFFQMSCYQQVKEHMEPSSRVGNRISPENTHIARNDFSVDAMGQTHQR